GASVRGCASRGVGGGTGGGRVVGGCLGPGGGRWVAGHEAGCPSARACADGEGRACVRRIDLAWLRGGRVREGRADRTRYTRHGINRHRRTGDWRDRTGPGRARYLPLLPTRRQMGEVGVASG